MVQPDLLAELVRHVATLVASPSTTKVDAKLDAKLFSDAELILPNHITPQQTLDLVKSLAALLQVVQSDPTPIVNLLVKLLEPFTLDNILAFEPPIDFVTGLNTAAPICINRLMLELLGKATSKASEAAVLAGLQGVVGAVVTCWLTTGDVGVAQKAGRLLVYLLRIDLVREGGLGQGLVWKRVFGDVDVYRLLFSLCSLQDEHKLGKARKGEGLLAFTVLGMVDATEDLLMGVSLVDFYSALLGTKGSPTSSPPLEWLIGKGVHDRTAEFYLGDSDSIESRFLYGPAANYLAKYAELYPMHYLGSNMAGKVNARLLVALDQSPARWAHAESPKYDLHLLASVPRTSLLVHTSSLANYGNRSPLSLLPSKATNADVLNTLATIFHGPPKEELTFPPSATSSEKGSRDDIEASLTRMLYYNYLAENPLFWQNITRHADTIALVDLALAAINCIAAVATANWSTTSTLAMPNATFPTPPTGHLAILSPPALEYTLPYLLAPAKSFSHLVGGRGDSESAAYRIGVAKHEALKSLQRKIEEQARAEPGEGYDEILATISRRVATGVTGNREGEVGGRVATMDM
ncbi:hypothetical protein B0A48_06699 [Cryoendolithus antarcticus]|uniref:DNA mismatch repair protein HSM3 N-terminal domain-containing protein n=1 Tax=Cryoendolithus antarcticus TaxID=1507870 RepID=A0A1V8T922_9PEZI|nr:hypothetical protein B0A48_06699 [Cryoendolithus antarcticus]